MTKLDVIKNKFKSDIYPTLTGAAERGESYHIYTYTSNWTFNEQILDSNFVLEQLEYYLKTTLEYNVSRIFDSDRNCNKFY
jgi:hypothetical protein